MYVYAHIMYCSCIVDCSHSMVEYIVVQDLLPYHKSIDYTYNYNL